MNPFSHFILTRFNVPLRRDPASRLPPEPSGVEEGWLSRRFELFERICLPSVARQTEGGFQWLVFMDWATPVAFKERMAAWAVSHEFLRPIYASAYMEETVLAEIRRREEPGRVRITTRLDSDDAIHPRMMERVQEKAREHWSSINLQQGFMISFPVGCCVRQGDFYLVWERLNPFPSFVSSPESARTVMRLPTQAGDVAVPVISRVGRPMWCQVIHEDNRTAEQRGLYWPWGGRSEFAGDRCGCPPVVGLAVRGGGAQHGAVASRVFRRGCLTRRTGVVPGATRGGPAGGGGGFQRTSAMSSAGIHPRMVSVRISTQGPRRSS
jgi:hypothetical protein